MLLFGMALSVTATALAQPPAAPSAALPQPPPPASIPPDQWSVGGTEQKSEGKLFTLSGNAWVENYQLLVRATHMEWNQETGDIRASGDVYLHDFKDDNEVWCDRLEYNTDTQTGKFFRVRGKSRQRSDPRPGILTSTRPFYFEGEWAERNGSVFTVHNGFFTNCNMPNPWWRLTGPKFVIEPHQKAVAYHTVFRLRKLPLFYTPFFYHSLRDEPRKSGFLIPNAGHSGQKGYLIGLGYYWAINDSYDLTYRAIDYTARGFSHNVDFRGNPNRTTDFYAIFYGVDDRKGRYTDAARKELEYYSGLSARGVGQSDLGKGWTARAELNYQSAQRFRIEWSQSYNDLIGSEMHSTGFVNKSWGALNLDAVFARLENFQTNEIRSIDPQSVAAAAEAAASGKTAPLDTYVYTPNTVTIRKLPEVEFTGRDQQFTRKIPIWYSFDSSAGLIFRNEPLFDQQGNRIDYHFKTGEFMNRVNLSPRIGSFVKLGDFHLVPSFTLHETYYSEGQEALPADGFNRVTAQRRVSGVNTVRGAREFALDMVFPPLARVFDKKTFLGDKLKHVIEPRAAYRYITGVGNNYNDFVRVDETDLLANTNELEISLTNRILAKRGDSVEEIFSWRIAQKRFFDPTFGGALIEGQRNIFTSTANLGAYSFLVGVRGTSPVISAMNLSPTPNLTFRWQADYDPRSHAITDSTMAVDYRWRKYFASAGNNMAHLDPKLGSSANQYRFRAGFGDPNNRGWNAGVDGVYDYRQGALTYTTFQVTRNTDCCGLSVQYRRFNIPGYRKDPEYRVAFAIANIGTFGTLKRQERMF